MILNNKLYNTLLFKLLKIELTKKAPQMRGYTFWLVVEFVLEYKTYTRLNRIVVSTYIVINFGKTSGITALDE